MFEKWPRQYRYVLAQARPRDKLSYTLRMNAGSCGLIQVKGESLGYVKVDVQCSKYTCSYNKQVMSEIFSTLYRIVELLRRYPKMMYKNRRIDGNRQIVVCIRVPLNTLTKKRRFPI